MNERTNESMKRTATFCTKFYDIQTEPTRVPYCSASFRLYAPDDPPRRFRRSMTKTRSSLTPDSPSASFPLRVPPLFPTFLTAQQPLNQQKNTAVSASNPAIESETATTVGWPARRRVSRFRRGFLPLSWYDSFRYVSFTPCARSSMVAEGGRVSSSVVLFVDDNGNTPSPSSPSSPVDCWITATSVASSFD